MSFFGLFVFLRIIKGGSEVIREELYFNCLLKLKLGARRSVRILNKDDKGR